GHAMKCVQQWRALGLLHDRVPVLDDLLDQPEGEHFIALALERTDSRVRAVNSVSPSFLFAALLWQLVNKQWVDITANGEHPIQALVIAADNVIDQQTRTLAIQRRFQADMREIWFMQPRFERATPRAIWSMLEHPRFRAAGEFLQL